MLSIEKMGAALFARLQSFIPSPLHSGSRPHYETKFIGEIEISTRPTAKIITHCRLSVIRSRLIIGFFSKEGGSHLQLYNIPETHQKLLDMIKSSGFVCEIDLPGIVADPENTWLRVDGKIISVQGTGGFGIYEI